MRKVSADALERMRDRRIAKHHSKATPPEREEWAMFHDCPPEQLRACLQYEYCRESKRIRDFITAWRKRPENSKTVASEAVDFAAAWINEVPGREALSFFVRMHLLQIPEFPQTPFSKLPESARTIKVAEEARCDRLHGYKCDILLNEHGGAESEITVGEGYYTTTYAVFGIPWQYSNKQLMDAFADYVKHHRKHPQYERRGRNELKSELKQLGALRLLRAMTTGDAATHTETILGYPLYSRDTAWTRAQREAEKALQEFVSFALPTRNI